MRFLYSQIMLKLLLYFGWIKTTTKMTLILETKGLRAYPNEDVFCAHPKAILLSNFVPFANQYDILFPIYIAKPVILNIK
jgi:hypothetical protein